MLKRLLFCAALSASINSVAAEFILLQTGKAIVKDIDEEKAISISENRDEVKKYLFDELKIKEGDTVDFHNVD